MKTQNGSGQKAFDPENLFRPTLSISRKQRQIELWLVLNL